jgi:hypothetical protein
MKFLARFARFWFDFIVGDDWTIALAVVVAIAVTGLFTQRGWNPWWLLPLAVTGTLAASLWRGVRTHDANSGRE